MDAQISGCNSLFTARSIRTVPFNASENPGVTGLVFPLRAQSAHDVLRAYCPRTATSPSFRGRTHGSALGDIDWWEPARGTRDTPGDQSYVWASYVQESSAMAPTYLGRESSSLGQTGKDV